MHSVPGPSVFLLKLLALVCAVGLFATSYRHPEAPPVNAEQEARVLVTPQRAHVPPGTVLSLRAEHGGTLFSCLPHDLRDGTSLPNGASVAFSMDMAADRLMVTPTAMQWRRPKGDLPKAMVRWYAEYGPDGSISPPAQHTFYSTDHGQLPVLSLTAHPGAWSDPDSGLLVVGNGIFTASAKVSDYYANDPRWWKYPGNFHGRGKEWERSGHLELIAPDGRLILEAPVGLRVNGQMTRGFPQHALRLLFRDPIDGPVFADGDGTGSTAFILRPAGNDQVKAMLRDAYQHRLCAELPFATSKALTCVVYINGAYWGVHHLRQRMDERELARRHGISAKKVALLEDRARPAHADTLDALSFMRLVVHTERWDGRSAEWLDTLYHRVDVDGFLVYMASQMILGNMDWPRQNVKWWRFTGKPRKEAPLDGRWYFIMGDTDLSFGANAGLDVDMFAQVKLANAPISRLFMAMYRNDVIRSRFNATVDRLLKGPLSAQRCIAGLDSMVSMMSPEMDRHTARWRKPMDRSSWEREVDVMRNYARGREAVCRQQMISIETRSDLH